MLAARLLDMHACPMVSPVVPPVPHVGGPISGPCVPTVLTCKMPQATITDMAICVGPPDTIVKGSATVLVSKKPAARITDTCAHGGMISAGAPTVMIGG
ncbi:PAAR domain-containing protein [Ruegeria sp. HKCCD8929]|uniref:PAAR domain-containing protein n=1 Tax=Ruegeria sp. HKCCD8929 TaxID=2683006 RepID=UPI0014883DBC|nr:PAAR domain-containing protein [Ruegeria sp. HKCCD8929]